MEIYQQLWAAAASAFENGHPQIDPILSSRTTDLRRGVTLAFRPAAPVRAKIKNFLDQLARVAPGQHLYQPEEFHVTMLDIISGTESWREEMRQLAASRAVLDALLPRFHSFKIRFQGVTASPGTVMIQGFPAGEALNKMRETVRGAFRQSGLADRLDRRYRITTAHMTIMRFRRPEADWKRLAAWLTENRHTDFGGMEVNRIQLIWGDWYASADIARTLQEYRLLEAVDQGA